MQLQLAVEVGVLLVILTLAEEVVQAALLLDGYRQLILLQLAQVAMLIIMEVPLVLEEQQFILH